VRIISGSLRGRRIAAVRGMATRPTTDRTREALFNILGQTVVDRKVLDLFAGTGALALEALSRGAESAVLVDNAHAALNTIKKNIQTCKLTAPTRVIQWDLSRRLTCLKAYQRHFDLVFMDPPYGQHLTDKTLIHLHDSSALGADALVVLEHHVDDLLGPLSDQFHLQDQRRYGKTLVSFIGYVL
jgi:16S rRNA (guanine966-N2)-methyltransferase